MKFLSLFLLATVMMFSCGEATVEDTTAEVPVVVAPEAPVAPAAPSMLEGTVNAVQSVGGDITALPAGAAASNIEGWITKLKTMDGTESIVADLSALKTELTSGDIDGSVVSGLLSKLADQTTALAGDSAPLKAIAGALQAGAKKLGGM